MAWPPSLARPQRWGRRRISKEGGCGGQMAEPSKDGWNSMPSQPHECAGCGVTLRMTKDNIWFDTSNRQSWHMGCRLERNSA